MLWEFHFPEKEELKLRLKDMLEEQVDEKYYLSDKEIKYVEKRDGGYTQIATEQTEIAHCPITAKGNDNWTGNFIKQVAQMYGTEREPNPQAGRVYDGEGLSPAMDSCSGGNRMPKILIKNNTQQGYLEAHEGDGVYTNISTKRGTVSPQISHTLTSFQDSGVVVKNKQYTDYSKKKILNNIVKGDIVGTITANAMQSFNHDNCHLIKTDYLDQNTMGVVQLKRGYPIEFKTEENYTNQIDILGNYSKSNYCGTPIVNKNGIAPTVRENHGQVSAASENYRTQNKRILKLAENLPQDKGTYFMDIYNQKILKNETATLKAGMDWQQGNIVSNELRIRKLTPKECWRLMGFHDDEFERAAAHNSNSQLYKQARKFHRC